jgi:hypothetical protein
MKNKKAFYEVKLRKPFRTRHAETATNSRIETTINSRIETTINSRIPQIREYHKFDEFFINKEI